jgi:hypothetical protein
MLTALLLLLAASAAAHAQTAPARATGQLLYLPIYSHVWHGDLDSKGVALKTLVSVLVSIRNTDPSRSIRVLSAQYYDTEGRKLSEFVKSPRTVKPMGTFELYVPRSETAGGSGANFVIAWQADTPANPPLVEALHLDLPAGRSIAFTTTARPILPD